MSWQGEPRQCDIIDLSAHDEGGRTVYEFSPGSDPVLGNGGRFAGLLRSMRLLGAMLIAALVVTGILALGAVMFVYVLLPLSLVLLVAGALRRLGVVR